MTLKTLCILYKCIKLSKSKHRRTSKLSAASTGRPNHHAIIHLNTNTLTFGRVQSRLGDAAQTTQATHTHPGNTTQGMTPWGKKKKKTDEEKLLREEGNKET